MNTRSSPSSNRIPNTVSLPKTRSRSSVSLWLAVLCRHKGEFERAAKFALEGAEKTKNPMEKGRLLAQAGILALVLVVVVVLAPIFEELFFRGALFPDLFPRRKRLGVVLSAGEIMNYHIFTGVVPWATFAVNWPYYLSLGFLFALLAWLRHFNLIAPIVAHGTFNSIVFILIYIVK